jgi:6-phosphogluconolactonase
MRSILRMFPSAEALSQAAARTFIRSAAAAIEVRGRFLAAISGGNTPTGMYTLLADPAMHRQVDWTRIFLFWTDERCVPPEQPGSNYGEAHRMLLQHVPIPEENVLRMRGELPPAEAAADYARILSSFATPPWEWPQFDLVLLGLGEDGHIASLFPGSPVEARTPTLAVTANYQDRPAQRVTLTPLVFNTARQIVFLVSGTSKAHALASVLEDSQEPKKYPALRIRPYDGELIWLVDMAAASKWMSNPTD